MPRESFCAKIRYPVNSIPNKNPFRYDRFYPGASYEFTFKNLLSKVKIKLEIIASGNYLADELTTMRFLHLNPDFLDHPCS